MVELNWPALLTDNRGRLGLGNFRYGTHAWICIRELVTKTGVFLFESVETFVSKSLPKFYLLAYKYFWVDNETNGNGQRSGLLQ